MPRTVTFLSDYGHRDEYVGVVHGVIARTAADVPILDLTHGIPAQDVRAGALALARALPFTPAGIHLAVVDPGVGSERRAVAVRTRRESRVLVGPDNGLLAPALAAFDGADAAVEISASPWRLEPVSATFHGRDLFAPVAAMLAAGAAFEQAGVPIDTAQLVALELPAPRRDRDGALVVEVVSRDGFGNLQLAAGGLAAVGRAPGDAVRVETATGRREVRCARAFAEVAAGEPLLYDDAVGSLALAVNRGDAATRLELAVGDEIRLLSP